MTELGFSPRKPITLYGDNQASISIAKKFVGHTRAKQIDIRFHYLRELVERAVVSIEYISTTSMLTRAKLVICSSPLMRLPRSPLIQASGYSTLELLRT